MKKAVFERGGTMMSNSMQEDGSLLSFEAEPPPTIGRRPPGGVAGFFPSRMHSRSASWSFTGSARPSSSDFSNGLASMNPIRSVIREFVPSLDTTRENTTPMVVSRSNSQLSFTGLRDEGSPRNLSSLGLGNANQTPPPAGGVAVGGEESSLSLGSDNAREQPFADAAHVTLTTGGDTEEAANMNLNNNTDIPEWVRWVEQNAIFFVVLGVRYAWIHRSGLLVLIGMFATYLHCNHTLKKQVALKNRRQKKILALVILFLCANIYFVYCVFSDYKLHNCLVFMTPTLFLDLWNLAWCIYVTDFIIRFATMVLKALIAMCFLRLLPTRKKGKYYMFLEHLSRFYRTLVPTPLWFGFCSNYYDTGAVFAIIITAGYLMIKGAVILASARELFKALCTFIHDKTYGIPLKKDELMESCETSCPICQDEYAAPIMLRCRHVFCEDCVLQWFDRERTCPLCRANIACDPKWRDGSTSAWPQLF